MCRYAFGVYACRWACFDCRKAFKAHGVGQPFAGAHDTAATRTCPDCAGSLVDLGPDFKPPRRGARSQWRKVKLLHEQGITFHSCGCNGPGARPRTLAEAKAAARELESVTQRATTLE